MGVSAVGNQHNHPRHPIADWSCRGKDAVPDQFEPLAGVCRPAPVRDAVNCKVQVLQIGHVVKRNVALRAADGTSTVPHHWA